MTLSRIADRGEMTHVIECGHLVRLVIDLKLQLLGREMRDPITMERLDEATKHIGKIQQCRRNGLCK